MDGMIMIAMLAIAGGLVAVGALAWQRRMARRALERALYPEICAMRLQALLLAEHVAEHHLAGGSFDAAFWTGCHLSSPLVYPATGAALGLLPGEGLDRVGYFHGRMADARAALNRGAPSLYPLLSNLLRACNRVAPWITALEPRFGPMIGGYPDVERASRLLESLELAEEEPAASVWSWIDAGR